MSAREVTLGKKVQSGSVGSSEPRASFEETYQLGKELGHGSFSTVREGTHKVGSVFGDPAGFALCVLRSVCVSFWGGKEKGFVLCRSVCLPVFACL